jgi:Sigma-70 region 2
MSAQSLENYNRKETGGPIRRRTIVTGDYEFLAAAKHGDSAAFEILCKQSANTVFRVVRRIVRNNEDAEDVVQESFQRVCLANCYFTLCLPKMLSVANAFEISDLQEAENGSIVSQAIGM